jgi:dipeptidyl aminopeptidase/acylaminoacyl peptidase
MDAGSENAAGQVRAECHGRAAARTGHAAGPSIQETEGEKGQSSTYENRDTLGNKHDEDVFDYYAASQLALVDASTGAITPVGKPANYESLDPAPDGRHILVATIHKPYSYLTTYDRFPRKWKSGTWPTARTWALILLLHFLLADRVPIRWRSARPARFFLARHGSGDARLGGSARWRRLECECSERDKIMLQRRRSLHPRLKSRGRSSVMPDSWAGANSRARSD